MGANKKFGRQEVTNQLRHVLREIQYPKNTDIDPERTHLNYSLTPTRYQTPREYLKERLDELHVHNRSDRVILSGWVITKPQDLPEKDERAFFEACYEFLESRYGGEKNVIAAEVHKDESGEPHIHFLFTPVTVYRPPENMLKVIEFLKEHPEMNNTHAAEALGISRKTVRRYRDKTDADVKHEKLAAKDVINKEDLVTFHKDLQKFLDQRGIAANVNSGITKAQGGNMTVEQLKMQREHLLKNGIELELRLDEKQYESHELEI
ncbi:MAG: plasmid recombination protein [Bacillota bacterium]|nr:plasmid recombination protein [Bacillota bacterium]